MRRRSPRGLRRLSKIYLRVFFVAGCSVQISSLLPRNRVCVSRGWVRETHKLEVTFSRVPAVAISFPCVFPKFNHLRPAARLRHWRFFFWIHYRVQYWAIVGCFFFLHIYSVGGRPLENLALDWRRGRFYSNIRCLFQSADVWFLIQCDTKFVCTLKKIAYPIIRLLA